MYTLTDIEIERLKNGIQAVFTIPFIDDIEDFVWEAIFSYVKDIPIIDPLMHIRRKNLFDVVDLKQSIGWSAKAVQRPNIKIPDIFEVVIQRADIFKKSKELGFDELTMDSYPEDLGQAILKHWYEMKVFKDAIKQGVEDKRICILLKSGDRKKYAYFEEKLSEYKISELTWVWTNSNKDGLQGIRKSDNFCVFRWYPNQKHLFERFYLPNDAPIVAVDPRRLPLSELVDLLITRINNTL